MGPTMNQITPYLFFDGKCREAMEFYKKTFGGDLNVMTYGDTPDVPPAKKNQVMHASLMSPELALFASDSKDGDTKTGDNVQLCINCKSVDQLETYFKALSAGGSVFMAPQDMFWGARFGILTDRYGFIWMLNHEIKK